MKCRVCANSHGNKAYQFREMMFGFRDNFIYFECFKCGCLQIKDFPKDMLKYYPSNYYSFTLLPPEVFNNPVKNVMKRVRDLAIIHNKGIINKFLLRKFSDPQIRSLSVLNITRNSRILDVGCGSGGLLYRLKNANFQNLLGIDPYIKSDIKYPIGLTILKKSIHELSGEWDLIMLHHSFEHAPDPLETLKSCTKLLANEGTIMIRIPTVSSFAWRYYKNNWVQLDAPRHLFLHSVDSIKILSSRAKLKLVDLIYDSTEFQFWGSEQYAKDIPLESEKSYSKNSSKSIFSKERIDMFKQLAEFLNFQSQGDQASVYFKK